MPQIRHNETIDTLLQRRSIRAFADERIDEDTIFSLETAAQHAASSQFLNDWSAIRIEDPDIKQALAQIGKQPYIAQAPLLYVFVLDEHRNAAIAQQQDIDVNSDEFTLNSSYRFSQAQNDGAFALHAMETAANSLGLGCVILGSILNDIDRVIDLLGLPQYTYPLLGLAIGKPAQNPAEKPRMPRSMQFFVNQYPQHDEELLEAFRNSTSRFTSITICVTQHDLWMRLVRKSPRLQLTRKFWYAISAMHSVRVLSWTSNLLCN